MLFLFTITLSYFGYIWTAVVTPGNGNKRDVVSNNNYDFIERSFSYNTQAIDTDDEALQRAMTFIRTQILGL